MADSNVISIALAGNPNCGKTTIFNNITGAKQHVGNYPGVTVEKKEGEATHNGSNLLFIDLPGTYSLTARSLDEVVARNVIVNDDPDLIVNVVDASNMERHLYLAAQLMELEKPMVVAMNMADIAEEMGVQLDTEKLRTKFGTTVVKTVGRDNIGTKELLDAIVDTAKSGVTPTEKIDYGPEMEPKISAMTEAIESNSEIHYPVRWLAVKLLEGDADVIGKVSAFSGGEALIQTAKALTADMEDVDLESMFQEARHAFATRMYNECLISKPNSENTKSDKIDAILTHRIFGLPIFAFIMWALFNAVIELGAYPQDWLDQGVSLFSDWVTTVVPEGQLQSLLVDGIIGGVGAVLSFLPLIIILFLGISFLEDTGYMARAAFVMDRLMRSVGLHGKSFIPMVLGFGCTVPAIMGTRILDNPKDRMVTILVAPFMSCSARLPVYTLLVGAFFPPEQGGTVLFLIYAFGVALAILFAKLFRSTLFKGDTEPFVMELPPYHLPTLKAVLTHMWERAVLYVKKAGTFILAASIIVWFMLSYPQDVEYSKDFDGARDQITQSFEQKDDQLMTAMGITEDKDKEDVLAMVEELTATAEENEDALAEEEEANAEEEEELSPEEEQAQKEMNEAIAAGTYDRTGEAVKAAAEPLDTEAFIAEAAEAPVSPVFDGVKSKNEKLFPVAWAVYQNQQAREEALGEVELEQKAETINQSYAASFGRAIEPVIAPLGFDWKLGVGLVAGMAAKEVLVSTLATTYAIAADDENQAPLQEFLLADPNFNTAVAISLIVFVLIYPPCLAALAVIKRETNSWKWLTFVTVYSIATAWVFAFIAYRIALAMGLGA